MSKLQKSLLTIGLTILFFCFPLLVIAIGRQYNFTNGEYAAMTSAIMFIDIITLISFIFLWKEEIY